MSGRCCDYAKFTSSVARQLLAGVTGLVLVLFILGHLAGNLLIFGGAEVFNAYAEQLASLGELIWLVRGGLLSAFLLHIAAVVSLTRGNRGTRTQPYAVTAHQADKTVASRFMMLSGVILFCFIFFHIYDFTLQDKAGPRSFVYSATDESLGLYGIVWNAFSNPLHGLFYIIAVAAVGMHLAHAISSIWVTLGVLSHRTTAYAERAARIIGALVFAGFASIPIYIFFRNLMGGAL